MTDESAARYTRKEDGRMAQEFVGLVYHLYYID